MKKAFLTASLLVAAGLAHAQSSVTLYGIVDTGVEWYNHAKGGGSFVGMPSLTGEVPSRWGMRGVEDLGGGYKAVFNLENGFAMNTGALNYGGRLFGRMANVGVSTPYGTILLGRVPNMTFWAMANADVMGPSLHAISNFDSYLPNARSDNAISYMGKFNGFTVGGTYSFGRDGSSAGGPSATNCAGQNPDDFLACKQFTGMLAYDSAKFGVATSYDQMRGGPGALMGLNNSAFTDTRIVVNGYYNFGAGVRIGGGWMHRITDTASTVRSDLYFLGGNWLAAPTLSLDLQGSHYIVHGQYNATLIAGRATYFLSKSTSMYGLLGYMINSPKGAVSIAAGGTVDPGANQTGAMIGIQHRF